ncbi:MAG TPA: hypothetical protein VFB22_02145 [Candidatus Baltobacteraceae bacterium]|nr:hypothetical protein [Candidatus Baltobacteraceae bacterium]
MRVWLSGGEAAVAVDSFTIASFPTASQLRATVARATFRVVLPTGLPSGARILRIAYAPSNRPTVMMVQYADEVSGLAAGFVLVATSTLGHGTPSIPGAAPEWLPTRRWTVGDETVLAPPAFAARGAARIEAAMHATTPAQSLAENDRRTWRLTVLGGRVDVASRAERLAANDHAVLLDRAHLRWIPDLLKQGRPMPDGRDVELTHIPSLHGEPDYAHATLKFTHTTALSLPGLKAVQAVMRASHTTSACRCEILVERPSGARYRVITIPFSPRRPVATSDVSVPSFVVRTVR